MYPQPALLHNQEFSNPVSVEEKVENVIVWNKSNAYKTSNVKPLRSLTGRVLPSTFLKGDISLTYLKRQIYPYFLMYLGSSLEDYTSYMMRDGISFDIEKYPIEKDLAKLNLIEFIEFCIKNQYKILHINQLEIV